MIRPVKVRIRFGKPFTIDYDGDKDEIPREVLDQATGRLMDQIEALLPEHMCTEPENKARWYGAQDGAAS